MAIRLVYGHPFGGSNSLGNPATQVAPNPPNPGNLLVAAGKSSTSAGALTIPNFTADNRQIGNVTHYLAMLKLLVAAGQTASIVMTDAGTPTTVQLGLAEFSGVTATEDAAAAVNNNGGTAVTTLGTGNIVTTTPSCLLVAYLGLQTANTATSITIDWGSGPSTASIITKANQFALAYRIVDAAGTYAATWAWPTSSRATTALRAFQGSGAPAGGGFFTAP